MVAPKLKTYYFKALHTARLAPLPAISDGVYDYLHEQLEQLNTLAAYLVIDHLKAPEEVLRDKNGAPRKPHGLRVFDPDAHDLPRLIPREVYVDTAKLPDSAQQLLTRWTSTCEDILDARYSQDNLLTWQSKTQLSSLRRTLNTELFKGDVPAALVVALDSMEKLVLSPNKIGWLKQIEKHCASITNSRPPTPGA